MVFLLSLFLILSDPQITVSPLGMPSDQRGASQPELVKLDRPYGIGELDDFAAGILADLQKPSFAYNVEFCGMIVTRDGRTLAATPARKGRAASCVIDYPEADSGLTIVASYHTHAGDDVRADGEVPSVPDLRSDMADGVPGFVSTPGGRLWKTDPLRASVRLICAQGCVARDPRFVDCPTRLAGDYFTLRDLEERERGPDGTCPVPPRFR